MEADHLRVAYKRLQHVTCLSPSNYTTLFPTKSHTSNRSKIKDQISNSMALYHSCVMSMILMSMVVVSSASELDNGYIPKPDYSVPDDQPLHHGNSLSTDSPTMNYHLPTNPTPIHKSPVPKPKTLVSAPPTHKMPKYNHPLPMHKIPRRTPIPVHRKPAYVNPIYIPKPIITPPIYKNPKNDTPAPAPSSSSSSYPSPPPPPPPSTSSSSSPLPPPSSSPPPPPPPSPANGAPPPYSSLDYIPAPIYDPPYYEPTH